MQECRDDLGYDWVRPECAWLDLQGSSADTDDLLAFLGSAQFRQLFANTHNEPKVGTGKGLTVMRSARLCPHFWAEDASSSEALHKLATREAFLMNTPLSLSFAQAHNTGEKGSRQAPREKKFEVFTFYARSLSLTRSHTHTSTHMLYFPGLRGSHLK